MHRRFDFLWTTGDAQAALKDELSSVPRFRLSYVPLVILTTSNGRFSALDGALLTAIILFGSRDAYQFIGSMFLSLFYRESRRSVVFDADGIHAETETIPRKFKKSSVSWPEFAAHGVVMDEIEFLRLSMQAGRGRTPSFNILIPKRLFSNDPDLVQFQNELSNFLEQQRVQPLFDFQFETDEDDSLLSQPEPQFSGAFRRAGALFGLIVSQFLLTKAIQQSPPVQLVHYISLAFLILVMVACAIVLVCDKKVLRRMASWFSRRSPTVQVIEVEPTRINTASVTGTKTRVLYGHTSEFDLVAFGRTGVVEESDRGFLLRYPARNGRWPVDRCWIPKRAFSSQNELDRFRAFIHSKVL